MQVSRIAVSNPYSASGNQKTKVQNQPSFGHILTENARVTQEAFHAVDDLVRMGVTNISGYLDAERMAERISAQISPDMGLNELVPLLRARMQAFTSKGLRIPAKYILGH